MKHCKELFWVGLGEERTCNKPAVYMVDMSDAPKPYKYAVCKGCAKHIHPRRLTKLAPDSKRAAPKSKHLSNPAVSSG